MSKTAIWFFGSNKLNSSNVVQITQRIVTWMMTSRFVYSKPENNVIEHHNPPWMGHCRWCSSLMAIFDAENKRNLVVWVNPFSFFLVCLLPARCRRPPGGPPEGPPGGHYNQSYIIIIIIIHIISLATVDNNKFCYLYHNDKKY